MRAGLGQVFCGCNGTRRMGMGMGKKAPAAQRYEERCPWRCPGVLPGGNGTNGGQAGALVLVGKRIYYQEGELKSGKSGVLLKGKKEAKK